MPKPATRSTSILLLSCGAMLAVSASALANCTSASKFCGPSGSLLHCQCSPSIGGKCYWVRTSLMCDATGKFAPETLVANKVRQSGGPAPNSGVNSSDPMSAGAGVSRGQ